MKSKNKKRILALVLSMVLMLSTGISAMAEGETPEQTGESKTVEQQEAAQESQGDASGAAKTQGEKNQEIEQEIETAAQTETTEEITEELVSEAADLYQDFKDEDGNVVTVIHAYVPEGAFQAKADQISMEAKLLDKESDDYIKSMIQNQLPGNSYLGGYVLYEVNFLVDGVITEPAKAITLTIEGSGLRVTDLNRTRAFRYDPADLNVEEDQDELINMGQKADVLTYLADNGVGEEQISEYEYAELDVQNEIANQIGFNTWKSTIYGCYTEAYSAETEFTQEVSGTTVKVTAPEGAFPMAAEEVSFTAAEITEEQEDVISGQLEEKAGELGQEVKDYAAYDLSFTADGEEVQPQVPVTVSFENTGLSVEDINGGQGFWLDEENGTVSDVEGTVENGTASMTLEQTGVAGCWTYGNEEVQKEEDSAAVDDSQTDAELTEEETSEGTVEEQEEKENETELEEADEQENEQKDDPAEEDEEQKNENKEEDNASLEDQEKDDSDDDKEIVEESEKEEGKDQKQVKAVIEENPDEDVETQTEEDGQMTGEDSLDYNSWSAEELYEFLSSLTNDAQYTETIDSLTEEKRTELYDYIDSISVGEEAEDAENDAVNYLNAEKAQMLLQNVLVQPAVKARALRLATEEQEAFNTSNKTDHAGLVISKKINEYDSATGDGKLQLESYVTGNVSTDVRLPVDIVLVLDQSGSMANRFGYKYQSVYYTNGTAYGRQNTTLGGNEYYFYKVGDTYYRVTIEREDKPDNYQALFAYKKIKDLWQDYRNDLYIRIDGQYYPVKFERTGNSGNRKYSASYTKDGESIVICSDQSGSTYWNTSWGALYTQSTTYSYTYSYTNEKGENHTIGISEGADNNLSGTTLYYRTEDTQNGTPKIDALKTAVNSFISSVRTDADKNNLDHKIAIVGFASEPDESNKYNKNKINTEILSISGDNSNISGTNRTLGKAYGSLGKEDYQSALREVDDTILGDAVNALATNGATRTDLGMEIAENILKNRQTTTVAIDGKSYERPTVVIMFTDGKPTTSSSFSSAVANSTVTYAGSMKAGLTVGSGQNEKKLQPTNVYTVGIFSGADASADPTVSSTSNENKFMQAVSSNYPNATKYNDLGEKNSAVTDGKSYYLSAGDGDALNQAFQSIAENIGGGAEAELDEMSVMYDKMSRYFKLPDGTKGTDIEVEVQETTDGGTTWTKLDGEGENLTVSIEGDIVKVTGFDYSEWYVANDHIGRKVVVTIPIEYKGAECFGGNNIPTNSNTSGMYTSDGKECYGNFEVPAVNNRINYEIDSEDQTIYITNQGVLANLLAYSDGYEPDGTKNAFVTITYTLKDSQENVLGTLTIPAGSAAADASWNWSNGVSGLSQKLYGCTEYTLDCEVSPVLENPATDADGAVIGEKAIETTCTPENPTIHVVTPDIQGIDQFIFLGEKAVFGEDVTWSTHEWSDKTTEHTNIPVVTGTAPQLEITPVLVEGSSLTDQNNYYPEKDSDFNIQVKVGTEETEDITRYCGITGDTSTAHRDCIGNESAAEHKFTIHVIGGKIQLYKQISGTVNAATEGNPVFTFKVTYTSPQDTQEVNYYTIEFKDNNHGERALVAELDNLKKGTYTIEELDTQRYDTTTISSDGSTQGIVTIQDAIKKATVTIGDSSGSKNKQTGVITYTNTKNQDPGSLTDTDVVINQFTYSNSENGYTFSQEEPTQVENKSIVSKAADFLSEAFN